MNSGWYEAAKGYRKTFVEDGDNSTGNFFRDYFPPDAIGSSSDSKVTFNPDNTGEYDFFDNGTMVDDLPDLNDPVPNEVQFYGEIHNTGSQMPGGALNTSHTTNAQAYYPAGTGNGYHNSQANVYNDDTRLFGAVPGDGSMDVNAVRIWDRSCTNWRLQT